MWGNPGENRYGYGHKDRISEILKKINTELDLRISNLAFSEKTDTDGT